MAFNFSLEKFKGDNLVYKIMADRIKYNAKDSTYTLFNYTKRTIGVLNDDIQKLDKKVANFNFELDDLSPTIYAAETLNLPDLIAFIDKEIKRGSSEISIYQVVLYKKFSVPVSAFILTIIGVAVSSMKRRGGMGMSLAIGIGLAFVYIFFDKIFGVLAEKSSIPPIIAVWIPKFIFGILAIYLLRNAKK